MSKKTAKSDIPSPPQKPSPNECCGSGCYPCVFDYYYTALEQWQNQWGQSKLNSKKKGSQ